VKEASSRAFGLFGLPHSPEVSTVRTVKLSARIAQHVVFRAAVALLFLGLHLGAMQQFAWIHFDTPWNMSPNDAPSFVVPDYSFGAMNWNRLVVSRWDSGQYIAMALDNVYGHCPTADLRGADLAELNANCDLPFYPAYAAMGWIASLGAKLPVDYALLGVSLLASFLLLFLWTGPVVVRALGVWGAYCSLILFNVYTTGFTLVTVLTEPCMILFTFAAFICIEKKRFFLAALLAGAASGMRVSGGCASIAFAAALLLRAWDAEELTAKQWVATVICLPLSAWGQLSMMAYDQWRFQDPFIYQHAHAQAFGHEPHLWHLYAPRVAWIEGSMNGGVHEILFAAVMVFWLAFGYREGLGKFSRPGQLYATVQFYATLAVSLYGSAELNYAGLTRYTLAMFAGFFAMGAVLKSRPIALVLWMAVSCYHYWNVDLCYYESHTQPLGMAQCRAKDEPPDGGAPATPPTPGGDRAERQPER
jgi:hypothetical protein